jgi:hypothetical protein
MHQHLGPLLAQLVGQRLQTIHAACQYQACPGLREERAMRRCRSEAPVIRMVRERSWRCL